MRIWVAAKQEPVMTTSWSPLPWIKLMYLLPGSSRTREGTNRWKQHHPELRSTWFTNQKHFNKAWKHELMKPTSSRIQNHMIHKSKALEQPGTSREGTHLYLNRQCICCDGWGIRDLVVMAGKETYFFLLVVTLLFSTMAREAALHR